MSSFSVEAFEIKILPHDNADALEIAKVGGYNSIVKKGEFKDGELVIFIPPQAVLPEYLLKELDLWDHDKNKGRLRGRDGNRLMPTRLRGVLSEGVCYWPPIRPKPGVDYAQELGIEKWIPTIPSHAAGQVYVASGITGYTDIDNQEKPLRKGGSAFDLVDGLDVVISEKLHGSCCIFYLDEQNQFHVSSKGQASKGLALEQPSNPARNWYWYAATRFDIAEKLSLIKAQTGADRVTLYGEVFGSGVQDLAYGLKDLDKGYRAFDLKLGHEYANFDQYESLMNNAGIEMVPYLYRGDCDQETVNLYRDGRSTLSGDTIREGVVIRPSQEIYDDEIGRVVIKAISPAYKTRKNGTEYN